MLLGECQEESIRARLAEEKGEADSARYRWYCSRARACGLLRL